MKKIFIAVILSISMTVLLPQIFTAEEVTEEIAVTETIIPIEIPLVNKSNLLSKDYAPDTFINISNFVPATKNSILLESTAAINFVEMYNAMLSDGITGFAAVSGYRDYAYQTNLFKRKVASYSHLSAEAAYEAASRVVAPPGASEHQLGLAIDVSEKSIKYGLVKSYEKTKSFQWLGENAWKYGYILRYDKNTTDITQIIYEPWHYRFVGVEHATAIVNSGLTLEEYIEMLQERVEIEEEEIEEEEIEEEEIVILGD